MVESHPFSLTRPSAVPTVISVLFAITASLAIGCSKPESTRWDEKAAEVKKGEQPKVDKSTVAKGETLNAYFPPEQDGLSRTFTQEKLGFVEATLSVHGKNIKASISDTNNNPSARDKFQGAPEQVAGQPLVTVGSRQSALLVNGRWQVKVSSSDLDAAQRKAMLATFNLEALSKR